MAVEQVKDPFQTYSTWSKMTLQNDPYWKWQGEAIVQGEEWIWARNSLSCIKGAEVVTTVGTGLTKPAQELLWPHSLTKYTLSAWLLPLTSVWPQASSFYTLGSLHVTKVTMSLAFTEMIKAQLNMCTQRPTHLDTQTHICADKHTHTHTQRFTTFIVTTSFKSLFYCSSSPNPKLT